MDTNKKQKRCKPMLTCVISIFAIASKAYSRTQHFDGPIVSIARKLVYFATTIFPFFRLFQWFLLPILSFADDRILSLEKLIQTIFPPSIKLFDKIDSYANIAEDLPVKFDDFLNKFPMIIHRVPFLDLALVYMISWLKFLISILTRFGSNTYKEKDILVDTSSKNYTKEKQPLHSSNFGIHNWYPSLLSVSSNCETKNEKLVPSKGATNVIRPPIISDITKCSYKEILEKGTNENAGKKVNDKMNNTNIKSEGDSHKKKSEGTRNEDLILQLFAASWHMKPPKGPKKDSMSRSASYTLGEIFT